MMIWRPGMCRDVYEETNTLGRGVLEWVWNGLERWCNCSGRFRRKYGGVSRNLDFEQFSVHDSISPLRTEPWGPCVGPCAYLKTHKSRNTVTMALKNFPPPHRQLLILHDYHHYHYYQCRWWTKERSVHLKMHFPLFLRLQSSNDVCTQSGLVLLFVHFEARTPTLSYFVHRHYTFPLRQSAPRSSKLPFP